MKLLCIVELSERERERKRERFWSLLKNSHLMETPTYTEELTKVNVISLPPKSYLSKVAPGFEPGTS